jgi:hypothetical protein
VSVFSDSPYVWICIRIIRGNSIVRVCSDTRGSHDPDGASYQNSLIRVFHGFTVKLFWILVFDF